MIGILIALLSGALMSVQGVFNTEVTKSTSIWVANGWVQLTALLVCVIAWFFTGKESLEGLMQIQPKYLLAGGVIGAFITLTVVKSMASLGPARAVMLIVISQLVVAYCIELLGLFGVEKEPFDWKKMIGVVFSILGFIIFKWK